MPHRVLLYAPDLIGHPRIYCRVIADALRPAGAEVILALGISESVGLQNSPDLRPLVGAAGIQIVDTRDVSGTRSRFLTAEELVEAERALSVDTTLFIEADKSESELRRAAAGTAPRLRGRALGIFAKTAEWYPGEDSFTGERQRLWGPTMRRTLGNVRRAWFARRKHPRHFFERLVIGRRVLDAVIVKDERLAEWRGPPVVWMPEISRPTATPETPEDRLEYERTALSLGEFRRANTGRDVALYFGDAAFYKGYDIFLEYVRRDERLCAVHAGQSYDPAQRGWFQFDVEALRATLLAQGRLFETARYVHTQRMKELFFKSVERYVTTHRLALSSSTSLQALELGRPLVVPDRGLIAHRVRANGLGHTYRYTDVVDLLRVTAVLRGQGVDTHREAIRRFTARFSDEAIQRFFQHVVLG